MDERLRDAAFAENLRGWGRAVAGYYGGPDAYRVWPRAEWAWFKGQRKLPIWVAGENGREEGTAAVQALAKLGVPKGVWTVADMEMKINRTYLEHFGAELNGAGYKVWVYGSASTVFGNPPLDGYWVADYAGIGPFMYQHANVEIRATQYASGPQFDSSTVKTFTYEEPGRWWR